MGWYNTAYNYTLQRFSRNLYKYGRSPIYEILKDEPEWSESHVIVGGGPEGEYHLITGYLTHSIKTKFEDHIALDYEVQPLPEGGHLTECKRCNVLLSHGMFIVADYIRGAWREPNFELVHCEKCHNIWDGCAQCDCWQYSEED